MIRLIIIIYKEMLSDGGSEGLNFRAIADTVNQTTTNTPNPIKYFCEK